MAVGATDTSHKAGSLHLEPLCTCTCTICSGYSWKPDSMIPARANVVKASHCMLDVPNQDCKTTLYGSLEPSDALCVKQVLIQD